jgi:hypothetical protein
VHLFSDVLMVMAERPQGRLEYRKHVSLENLKVLVIGDTHSTSQCQCGVCYSPRSLFTSLGIDGCQESTYTWS